MTRLLLSRSRQKQQRKETASTGFGQPCTWKEALLISVFRCYVQEGVKRPQK